MKLGRTSTPKTGDDEALNYQSSASLTQFSKNGNPIKQYTFSGLYPLTLTDIPVSWDTTNAVEEFTATFEYQYYTTNYISSEPGSRTLSKDNWIGKGTAVEQDAIENDFDLTLDDDA